MGARQLMLVVVMGILIAAGCSSQKLLSEKGLQEHQTVKIELGSGESVEGEIAKNDAATLVIKDHKSKFWRANKSDIVRISGPVPVYDYENKIISEQEISQNKKSTQTWYYVLGGGVLSLGSSFFLGSMISRAGDGDLRDGVIWSVAGVGTAVGAFLFARKGSRKDRLIAIDDIREKRANGVESELDLEQERKRQIHEEIARLKAQRMKQEEEIKALKQSVQKKKQE